MLKANAFRWSPQAGLWWRHRVDGAADFLTALDRKLNPGRPDGACWECKDPAGFFRPMGAAAPVLCNSCFAIAKSQRHYTPAPVDRTDLDYEDACPARAACEDVSGPARCWPFFLCIARKRFP